MKRLISVTLSFIIMLTSGIIINAVEAESNLQAENTFSVNPSSYVNEDEDEIVKEEKKICKATIEDDFADDTVIVVFDHKTSLKLKEYTADDFKQVNAESVKNLTLLQTNSFRKEYNKSLTRNKAIISKDNRSKKLSESEIDNLARDISNRELEEKHSKFHEIVAVHLKEKGKQNVLDTVKELEKLDNVICVEPNYTCELGEVPNDTKYDKQWAPGKINLESAWNLTTGSYNVTVGVIDTGIASSHTDISPNIDTTLSHSFVDNAPLTDTDGHGTSVAGVIGAKGNNNKGVAGVCWNVKLVSLKVMHNNNDGYTDEVISAIAYAENNNIDILNFSSTTASDSLESAIQNYNGVFVCISGNYGQNIDSSSCSTTYVYPSKHTCSNIISVASIDENNDLASSSNYGATSVDIAAPGVEICVAKISDTYGYKSGTSFAAPHVAGVAALIKSEYPDISYQGIKAAILNNTTSVSSLNGKVKTGGKLNARAAIDGVINHHYTVKYNKKSGSGATMSNTTVTYGLPSTLSPNTYTKSGYHFNGWLVHRQSDNKWYYNYNGEKKWFTEANAPSGAIKATLNDGAVIRHTSSVPNDIVTLYVDWAPNTCQVEFNSSFNSSNSMAAQIFRYDHSKQLSLNQFYRNGYSFSGWFAYRHSDNKWLYTNGTTQLWCLENQQPNGYSKKLFYNQETVLNLSSVHEDTVTMYAQWNPNCFYLDYSEYIYGPTEESVVLHTDELFSLGNSACSNNGNIIIGWNVTDYSGNWLTPSSEWMSSYSSTDCFILPNRELSLLVYDNNTTHYYAIAQWASNSTMVGDVNLDGIITSDDISLLQSYFIGTSNLSNRQKYTADFDQNGIININDATSIQLYLNQQN